MISRLQNSIY